MKIAIIGGGASGLVAGIMALRAGARVSIFEKNNKIGKKILASGNGRCNVSNKNINIKRYHGSNVSFAKFVLNQFGVKECEDFFKSLGVNFVCEENKLYPASLQSLSISEALEFEFKRLGGKIHLNTCIKKIEKKQIFYLHEDLQVHEADKLLLACGSCAMSKLGGSYGGYDLAKSLGHNISALLPSLVQLVCEENTAEASGVKFKSELKLLVDNVQVLSVFKDVLITKYGISGSAVLDASGYVSRALIDKKQIKVFVDVLPNLSKEKISKILNDFLKTSKTKPISMVLNGLINKKLSLLILRRCKIEPNIQAEKITKKQINSIVFNVKQLSFTPIDTKGFENAEVVNGGVYTDEVDEKTLQSKLVKNLYFSGELLDIDGDCGGFNLHWAWASGYVSGLNMAKTKK